MVIRPARLPDRDEILRLIIEMQGHEAIGFHDDPLRVLGEVLACADSRAFVAERNNAIVGYAEIHAHVASADDRREARLTALAIDSSARRTGVGTALLAEAELAAGMLGCNAIVLDSSLWRDDAHAFYRKHGFSEKVQARRFVRSIAPSQGSLETRFLAAAGQAASAVRAAIHGLGHVEAVGFGADGAPTEAADRAAEEAALAELLPLGLPIVSEEAGLVGAERVDPDGLWISLDPLDGSRNFVAGYPPYAVAIGLIEGGRARAGFVCDLDGGHRWWAIANQGAWRNGHHLRHRTASRLVGVPSPFAREPDLPRFENYARLRISGSSTVDLCRVAEGSLAGFVTLGRPVIHVHDLAAPLVIILESTATVLDKTTGEIPVLVPDPKPTYEIVAAANPEAARALGARALAGRTS